MKTRAWLSSSRPQSHCRVPRSSSDIGCDEPGMLKDGATPRRPKNSYTFSIHLLRTIFAFWVISRSRGPLHGLIHEHIAGASTQSWVWENHIDGNNGIILYSDSWSTETWVSLIHSIRDSASREASIQQNPARKPLSNFTLSTNRLRVSFGKPWSLLYCTNTGGKAFLDFQAPVRYMIPNQWWVSRRVKPGLVNRLVMCYAMISYRDFRTE